MVRLSTSEQERNEIPVSVIGEINNATTTISNAVTTDLHSISNYSLHPGFTTLISFGISLLLVALYLYAEEIKDCLCCLTCHVFRVKPDYDEESLAPTTIITHQDSRSQGTMTSGNNKIDEINEIRNLSLWESDLSCDCGEIHKARHCIRTSHFQNDLNTFMKSVSLLSESSSPTISQAPLLASPRGSLQPLARGHSLPTFSIYQNRNSPSSPNSNGPSQGVVAYPTLHPVPEYGPSSSRQDQIEQFHPRHFKRSLSTVA